MAKRQFSEKAKKVEQILNFNPDDFRKYFRSISWQDFRFMTELDESSEHFASIFERKWNLKKCRLNYLRNQDDLLEKEMDEIFESMGFLFALALYLEKECEHSTKNFASRAPSQFENWIAERESRARRSKLQAVK
mgnify:CR=1 FL=1